MKKYFLHNGTESSGPFDLDELIAKKITKTTHVWFEGMEKWSTAGNIEELKSLFILVPPPIYPLSPPSPTQKVDQKKAPRKIMGLSKNIFFIGLSLLIILVGITVLNILQENRSQELEIKNHKTEVENYQYERLQKEIEEQKIIDAEIEKVAAERMLKEKKDSEKNRLIVIQQKITEYQTNLTETEKKLNNTSDFKFLRTAAEKKEQLYLLQKNIDSFKTAIIQLKNESYQLQLDLEKIQ